MHSQDVIPKEYTGCEWRPFGCPAALTARVTFWPWLVVREIEIHRGGRGVFGFGSPGGGRGWVTGNASVGVRVGGGEGFGLGGDE